MSDKPSLYVYSHAASAYVGATEADLAAAGYVSASQLADVTAKLEAERGRRKLGQQREASLVDDIAQLQEKLEAAEGRVRELRVAYDAHKKYFDLKIAVRQFLFGSTSEAAKPAQAEPGEWRRCPRCNAAVSLDHGDRADCSCGGMVSREQAQGVDPGTDLGIVRVVRAEYSEYFRSIPPELEPQPPAAQPAQEKCTCDPEDTGPTGHMLGCPRLPPAAPGTPLTVEEFRAELIAALRAPIRYEPETGWSPDPTLEKLADELERAQRGSK